MSTSPIFRHLFIVVYLGLVVFPSCAVIYPCSWDYPIWQIRSKNADPLYRFIKNGRAGYIDKTGKIVIKPSLPAYGNYGGEFHNGLLLTGVAAGPYVNATGKIALDTGLDRNWDFSDGLAAAMREGENKWGFIDTTGKFAIEPQFESYPNGYVYSFSEGLAMVKVIKRFGFIDQSGDYAIPAKFAFAQSFSDGFAKVVIEGPCIVAEHFFDNPCPESQVVGGEAGDPEPSACKYTFINKEGNIITDSRFDGARDFSEGLAAVEKDGKWGYVDGSGRMVIPFQFDRAYEFSDGLARVGKDRSNAWDYKWGYINKFGAQVIPYTFEYSGQFSYGLAPVWSFDKKKRVDSNFYFIDKTGKRAIPGTYELASHFHNGIAHVKLSGGSPKAGKYAYINTQGHVVFSYDVDLDD